MVDRYIAMLQDARDRLEDGSLSSDFAYANRVRGSIPRDAKGLSTRSTRFSSSPRIVPASLQRLLRHCSSMM